MAKIYTTQLNMHYVVNIGKVLEGKGRDPRWYPTLWFSPKHWKNH